MSLVSSVRNTSSLNGTLTHHLPFAFLLTHDYICHVTSQLAYLPAQCTEGNRTHNLIARFGFEIV
jgi:hypothetical protein